MKTQKASKNITYGSVSFAYQHISDFPFGEDWIDLRKISWDYHGIHDYQFSGKEKDPETGFNYFGARYYDSDLSIWLSVDPLADKDPGSAGRIDLTNKDLPFFRMLKKSKESKIRLRLNY